MNFRLIHQAHAMAGGGLEADSQPTRDLFGRIAFTDELQDLALARRRNGTWARSFRHLGQPILALKFQQRQVPFAFTGLG